MRTVFWFAIRWKRPTRQPHSVSVRSWPSALFVSSHTRTRQLLASIIPWTTVLRRVCMRGIPTFTCSSPKRMSLCSSQTGIVVWSIPRNRNAAMLRTKTSTYPVILRWASRRGRASFSRAPHLLSRHQRWRRFSRKKLACDWAVTVSTTVWCLLPISSTIAIAVAAVHQNILTTVTTATCWQVILGSRPVPVIRL